MTPARLAFLFGLVWFFPAAADTGAADTVIAIYENGFSLVDEKRTTDIVPGRNIVSIDDLPEGFQADTAVVDLGDSKIAELRAQRFRRASADLLSRFEGQKVHIVNLNPATGEEVVREGVLLRASPLLVKVDGRVEVSPPGRIALPGLPEGAVLKSRLVLDFDAARAGALEYRLVYLASGPGWSADYALRLDPSGRGAILDGRANLRIPGGGPIATPPCASWRGASTG